MHYVFINNIASFHIIQVIIRGNILGLKIENQFLSMALKLTLKAVPRKRVCPIQEEQHGWNKCVTSPKESWIMQSPVETKTSRMLF